MAEKVEKESDSMAPAVYAGGDSTRTGRTHVHRTHVCEVCNTSTVTYTVIGVIHL
jgi:hypothetical protein